MDEFMTVAGIAGVTATAATALLSRATTIPPKVRAWVAIGAAVLAAVAGLWLTYWPHSWELVAGVLAATLGVTQVVYVAFKPVWKLVSGDTTLTPPADADSCQNDVCPAPSPEAAEVVAVPATTEPVLGAFAHVPEHLDKKADR